MWTSLKCREHRLINLALEASFVLTEKDHTSSGTAETLVGSCGDDIAVIKGVVALTSSHDSRNMRHVHKQEGSISISNSPVLGIVPISRVCTTTSNDHSGLEESGGALQLIVIDNTGYLVHPVRKRFKVYRGRRHSLASSLSLGVGVESMCQMSTRGQVQAHDTIMWPEKCSVYSKVGRRSRVRLNIHAPLFRVKTVCLECTLLTENFDLVYHLISSIVASMGKALRILVGEAGSEALHYSLAGEVLTGDEFEGSPLSRLLLFDQIMEDRIMLLEGCQSSKLGVFE
mmetsp:Transcript_26403/g.40875  ORF Transcript_26403/g.40875 Transcript_26403/m.40875 type:complete len:286 (+) Transcript_26403:665-1522(+)